MDARKSVASNGGPFLFPVNIMSNQPQYRYTIKVADSEDRMIIGEKTVESVEEIKQILTHEIPAWIKNHEKDLASLEYELYDDADVPF